MMFKTVCLLKRRDGMSMKDFMDYYESHHRKIGEKVLPKGVYYVRRFLHGVPNPLTGELTELEFDCLTEMWFESKEAFEVAMEALSEPSVAAEIAEDEEKLFDRSKIRFCTIEEHKSAQPEANVA